MIRRWSAAINGSLERLGRRLDAGSGSGVFAVIAAPQVVCVDRSEAAVAATCLHVGDNA